MCVCSGMERASVMENLRKAETVLPVDFGEQEGNLERREKLKSLLQSMVQQDPSVGQSSCAIYYNQSILFVIMTGCRSQFGQRQTSDNIEKYNLSNQSIILFMILTGIPRNLSHCRRNVIKLINCSLHLN